MIAAAIGITGHRPSRIAAERLAPLAREIADVFVALDAALRPRPRALISSLAEGADTMAAEAAQALGWQLIAPLPFPVDDFRKDFTVPEAQAAFDRLIQSADEIDILTAGRDTLADEALGYRAASLDMLARSTALLAVWNGAPMRQTGGTFETMIEALGLGLPVLWLDARASRPPRLLGPHDRESLTQGQEPAGSGGLDALIALLR